MPTALSLARRIGGVIAPALGALLLCSLVVVAVHHHDATVEGHPCAVCNAGNAPAVPTVAAAGAHAPAAMPERIETPATRLAPRLRGVAISSRAPPLA